MIKSVQQTITPSSSSLSSLSSTLSSSSLFKPSSSSTLSPSPSSSHSSSPSSSPSPSLFLTSVSHTSTMSLHPTSNPITTRLTTPSPVAVTTTQTTMSKETPVDISFKVWSSSIQVMGTNQYKEISLRISDMTSIHLVSTLSHSSLLPIATPVPSLGNISKYSASLAETATPPPPPVVSGSNGRSHSLLAGVIGSAVGVVGVLMGVCIGLLVVIVALLKRRSLSSCSSIKSTYRTCEYNVIAF